MKLPILYGRSSTGKISTWEIEYTEDSYRTISGYHGMKLVQSEWTKCEGKSYNTTAEQTEKQAKAMWTKKKKSGMFEDIKDVDKETFFEPMLAKDWEKEKHRVKYPIYSQPKLDGVRCIIKKDGMWTRNGKEIISAPHIFESVKKIFDIHPNLVLDGELYTDKLANDFNKIISCVRKTKPTPEDLEESKKWIEYWIYDYEDGNKHIYSHRLPSLNDVYNLSQYNYVKIVPTLSLDDEDQVNDMLISYLEEGYEGQILRLKDSIYENKRTKSLLKHKQFQTEEFVILGVNEGKGKLYNKVGDLVVKTKYGVEVDVPVNGSHDFLADLWNKKYELIGREATVRYFGYTEDGSLRFPKVIDIDRWKFE